MVDKEKVLDSSRKNLERNRAVATGIGIFAVIVSRTPDGREWNVLLRKRIEKDSLYNQDLSGKWELPGGGMDLLDFGENADYQQSIRRTISREVLEETGLEIDEGMIDVNALLPAFMAKDGIIDLAFAVVISLRVTKSTLSFEENLEAGRIKSFNQSELDKINIISPRMKFLITASLEQVSRINMIK